MKLYYEYYVAVAVLNGEVIDIDIKPHKVDLAEFINFYTEIAEKVVVKKINYSEVSSIESYLNDMHHAEEDYQYYENLYSLSEYLKDIYVL